MVFLYVFFFILGSVCGSFLNVVIDRTVQGRTILGRSRCDWCGRALGTRDLIPIASFLAFSGKCRVCRKPLSWQYPIVEFLCGALFVLSFWKLAATADLSLISLFYLFFISSVLVIVSAVDFKFSLIPTSFVFSASLVALFFNYFNLTSVDFVGSVAAALGLSIAFGAIIVLSRGRGMGQGDAVLAFLIGMVLGVSGGILAVFTAFLTGAIVALFLIFLGKKRLGQAIPFGPFLVLGFFISLFFGSGIINWYLMLY